MSKGSDKNLTKKSGGNRKKGRSFRNFIASDWSERTHRGFPYGATFSESKYVRSGGPKRAERKVNQHRKHLAHALAKRQALEWALIWRSLLERPRLPAASSLAVA